MPKDRPARRYRRERSPAGPGLPRRREKTGLERRRDGQPAEAAGPARAGTRPLRLSDRMRRPAQGEKWGCGARAGQVT
jgi:hypothetical protein